MFGLFRRNKAHQTSEISSHQLTLISVSEPLKSMKRVDFEMADQSLEDVYEWLSLHDKYCWFNGGHYNLNEQPIGKYQLQLSSYLGAKSLPVVLTNNTETLLYSLPLLASPRKELGIVHIGRQFELKACLEPDKGSAFHFALSRYSECRLFCLGIDGTQLDEQTAEYAEDLGCDWLTLEECSFGHRLSIKQQIASYLSHCDDIALNIDLDCLYPLSRIETGSAVDLQVMHRIVRQLLLSGKVRQIQLVGYKDKHLYSKQTLGLLRELAQVYPISHRAA